MAPGRARKGQITTRKLSFNKSLSDSTVQSPLAEISNTNNTRKHRRLTQTEDTQIEEDPFIDILGKSWKVFRVSLMYGFHSNKMKFYAKKLKDHISSLNYKSEAQVEADFSECCFDILDEEVNGLKVVVKKSGKNIYVGYFLSPFTTISSTDNPLTKFTTIIVKSNAKTSLQVHNILCKLFDCFINPLSLSLLDLLRNFVRNLTLMGDDDESDSHILLQYHVPGLEAKNIITLTLDLQDTNAVLKGVYNELEDHPADSIVMGFYDRVLHQILRHMGLDLVNATLQQVTFPKACINLDGNVKWYDKDIAGSHWSFLQALVSKFD